MESIRQKAKKRNFMKIQHIIDNLSIIRMNRQWQIVNAEAKQLEQDHQYSKQEKKKKIQQLRYKIWEISEFDYQNEFKSLYIYERMLQCNFMMSNISLNQNQVKKSHKYLKRAEQYLKTYESMYDEFENISEREFVIPYEILASMFDYECAYFYFSIKQYRKSVQILVKSFKKYEIQCQNTRVKQLELFRRMVNDCRIDQILESYHENRPINKQFLMMLDFSGSLDHQGRKKKAVEWIMELNEMVWQSSKRTGQKIEVGFVRFNKNRDEVFKLQNISDRFKFMQQSIKQSQKLKPEGQSAILDQIYKSYRQLQIVRKEGYQQYLIVVTDGQDSKSKLGMQELIQKSRSMGNIRTLVLGIGFNEELTNKYQQLKELNIHNVVVSKFKREYIEVAIQTVVNNSTDGSFNLIVESLV